MTEKKKGIDLKKLMEAGALLAESRARGSSGGIASALQKSGIDLSGKDDGGTNTKRKGKFKPDPKTEANEEHIGYF